MKNKLLSMLILQMFPTFISMVAYYNLLKMLGLLNNPYALMILGVCGGLLLIGLTDYTFQNTAVMKTFWFLLGCLFVLKKSWREKT